MKEIKTLYADYNPMIGVVIGNTLRPQEIVTVEEFCELVEKEHPHPVNCIIDNEEDLSIIKSIAVNAEYY